MSRPDAGVGVRFLRSWLSIRARGALLIDTGLDASVLRDPAEQFGSVLKRLFVLRVARGQDVVSQARARGVEAGAIGTVVLTHLHYDHAGGAGQLPHATFLFDSREWAPAVRGRLLEGYRRGTVDRPLDWRTLEFAGATAGAGFSHTLDLFGDDSVRLVSTPGHSPGHLSVLLRTASGACAAGGRRRLYPPRDRRGSRSARPRRSRCLPQLARESQAMG
jgi:N-acyl homoserine lactone hydrolase